MWRSRRGALARRGVGVRHVAALQFGVDAAHDAFGHRVRGRQHGEIDLQHGAKSVVMAVQGGEQLGGGAGEITLAAFQMRDGADIAARAGCGMSAYPISRLGRALVRCPLSAIADIAVHRGY